MSSGFVSAGTNEQPIERDDEWLKVQKELEEERRRKAEIGKQDEGKSLFEVLERNKMAKQEAFEEKSRLKNQFRSLDDDEVDFLDSVLESTRAKEAAIKKETADQLEAFRRQREQADKGLLGTSTEKVDPGKAEDDWSAPVRKRRRDKKKESLISKRRKSSVATNPGGEDTQKGPDSQTQAEDSPGTKPLDQKTSKPNQATTVPPKPTDARQLESATQAQPNPAAKPAPKPLVSLGLGDYASDSE